MRHALFIERVFPFLTPRSPLSLLPLRAPFHPGSLHSLRLMLMRPQRFPFFLGRRGPESPALVALSAPPAPDPFPAPLISAFRLCS